MRPVPALLALFLLLCGVSYGDEPLPDDSSAGKSFERLDKNGDGFIAADELGELHQRRLDDPKSMKERLESGDVPQPMRDRKPE